MSKENEALTQDDEEFSVDDFFDGLKAMAEPPKNSLKMITMPEWLAWNLLSAHKSDEKDKRIKELEVRIAKARIDLRMAALSEDCPLHLSAYLGAISHGLEGGADE